VERFTRTTPAEKFHGSRIVSPSSANERADGARFKLISNCRARRDAGLFLAEFAPFAAHAAPVAELSIARCKILFHSLRRRRTRPGEAAGRCHRRFSQQATLEFAQKFFRPANDLSGIK
jgi:hypothetical protein